MGSRPRSATDWSAVSTIQTSCVLQHGAQCTAVRRKRLTSQSATAISVAECVACILSSDAGRGPGARSMSTARLRIPARIARIDAGRGPDGRPSANLAIRSRMRTQACRDGGRRPCAGSAHPPADRAMAAMFSTRRVRHAGAMAACARRLSTRAVTLHAINPATLARLPGRPQSPYPRSQFQPSLVADRYSTAMRAVLPHRGCFSVRTFRTRDATAARIPAFHDAPQTRVFELLPHCAERRGGWREVQDRDL